MNKTYRNIWNAATGTWTAVAETAKSHSKGSARAARSAVVALALGGASIGGVFAADACTTADGVSGSLDAAGVCQVPVSSKGARSIGTMAAVDDMYMKVRGTTTASTAAGTQSIAIGDGAIARSSTGGETNIAIGAGANTAGAFGQIAFGENASTQGNTSGGAIAIGRSATTTVRGVALGDRTSVTAANSVALGDASVANRVNSVSVGDATNNVTRQIVNVTAGTQATDAVNLAQMQASIAAAENPYVVVNTGSDASATAAVAGNSATAIGANANANAQSAVAIGGSAIAGRNGTALGTAAQSTGASSVSLGGFAKATTDYATAIGYLANSSGYGGASLGSGATAGGSMSVALGTNSVATADNTVSVGDASKSLTRKIVNVGTGAQANDAVNVSQLSPVVAALGGNASINATTGVVTGPTYTLANGGRQTTVGGALSALDGVLTTANTNIAQNATDITTINNKLAAGLDNPYVKVGGSVDATTSGHGSNIAIGSNANSTAVVGNSPSIALGWNSSSTNAGTIAIGSTSTASASETTALGLRSTASANNATALGGDSRALTEGSVALGFNSLADRAGTVSVGNATAGLTRQITNMAAGTQATDAVNVSQLEPVVTALGGKAAIDPNTGVVTGPTYDLANGGTQTTIGGALGELDKGLTTANTNIAQNTAGIAQNTADITTINNKLAAGLDNPYIKVGGDVDAATSGNTSNIAIGSGAVSSADPANSVSIALGRNATSTNAGTVALGTDSTASGSESIALGLRSTASADASVVLGGDSKATAKNAVAIGTNSLADREDTVSVGSAAKQRQITNMAAGTQQTDAVNVSQLEPVVAALGGNAKIDPNTGAVTGPTYDLANGGTQTTVGGALGELDKGLTTANTNIAKNADDITTINNQLGDLSSGTIGIVQQAGAGADITVGANTDGANVNFTGKDGERKLIGVAAGDVSAGSFEAVNGSQLHGVSESVAAAIGGDSVVNADGSISAPDFKVGDGNGGTTTVHSVGDVVTNLDGRVTNLDGRVTNNEGDIAKLADQIGSGTVGLVQQAGAGADITVGANADGANVNFTGTAGDRKLIGVAAGEVSVASNEAVNGSQLHGVAESVAAAIGGDSVVNPDGSISAPKFEVGDGKGGTTIVNNLGDVVTNLDGRVTSNEGDITKLADQIGSGTVGLVQQAGAGADLTVGANTDGANVNFTGTAGDRKLTGVAAGEVSAASNEAINGSQLHGVAESVAAAIGGDSVVNPDGSISAPKFEVGDGKGGTTIVNNLGDVVTNLDGRVTSNEGDITKLGDQLASGQIGLVQQDPATGAITVGANAGGSTVSFAGTGGARTLTGVANGVNDDDAVTIAQLKATGLIDYTGKEIAAVTYDDISLGSVTFGGSGGTALHNIAPGLISATSMDAVNGSQLYDLQQKFAQQYDQLNGQMDDLTGRVGDLEVGGGSGGGSGGGVGPGTGGDGSLVIGDGSLASGENGSAIGQGAVASGDNSSAVGQGAVASGNNGSAVGQGAVASGDNGSAFGQGSVASGSGGTAIGQGSAASGSDSTAVGQGSVASGDKGTAIGQGSSATGNGSVAIGAGSVADRDNSVSVGSAGNERQITNVADGTAPTDAVNVRQMEQRFGETNRMINDVAKNAYAGVAAAMAMPNLTPSQPGKTVVAVGAANYKSGSAVAAGATYRTRDGKWLMNGAVSVTSTGDAGVRAQVGYEF